MSFPPYRRWTFPTPSSRALAGVCAVGLAALAWAYLREQITSAHLTQTETSLRQRQSLPPKRAASVGLSKDDYTARLPADSAPAAQILDRLQALATKHAVRLASVHTDLAAPSPERLGRTTLTLALRGSYVGIKAVLASAQEEFPSLTVQSVSLARSPQDPSVVDVSSTLVFWSRPASLADRVASR